MKTYFSTLPKIEYEGKTTDNPLAFRYYNPDEVIAGKTMREHLKFAMSYWHTMCAEGSDMFGVGTADKSYGATDVMEQAKNKALAAFELMEKLEAEIPEVMFDNELNNQIRDIDYRLSMQGMNFETYLQYMGMTVEMYKENAKESALKNVKIRLALEKIAALEALDVTEEERFQVNAYLERGLPLSETGMVNLTGAQAVSYSRIRKIDSDSMRASRQREVLAALFDKALEINPLNYPSYVRKFSPMVETSLSNDEILKIAKVGLKGSSLSLEQAAFPNDYIQSGGETINGGWYYVYDLDQATDMLHQYIYEDIPFEHYGLTEEEIAFIESMIKPME